MTGVCACMHSITVATCWSIGSVFRLPAKKIWLIISRPCQCLHLLKARASFWIFYRHGSHTKIAYWKMAKNAWSPLSNSCFLLFFFRRLWLTPLRPKKWHKKLPPLNPLEPMAWGMYNPDCWIVGASSRNQNICVSSIANIAMAGKLDWQSVKYCCLKTKMIINLGNQNHQNAAKCIFCPHPLQRRKG